MFSSTYGDLWDNYKVPNNVIVVTTNNQLDSRGNLIMGAGTAKQAKLLHPTLPMLMSEYGDWDYGFIEFPKLGIACLQTKRAWKNNSPLDLIQHSLQIFAEHAKLQPQVRYNMPRPGCGLGGLLWEDVKPLCEILPSNVYIVHPDE